jgi:hypothetical protein
MEDSRLCVDTRSCVWSVHSFRDPVLGWGKQEGWGLLRTRKS